MSGEKRKRGKGGEREKDPTNETQMAAKNH